MTKVIAISLIVLFSLSANSQILNNQKVQILLKGKIYDEYSNEPMPVNIEFKDSDGKKINIFSNSSTGNFEQILDAGKFYKVKLTKENILRQEFDYTTKQDKKYSEDSVSWTVKKLSVGANLFDFDLFEMNSELITENGKKNLDKVLDALKFNRSISLAFKVSSNDSYVDDKKTTSIKLEDLFKKRIASIEDYIKGWTREKSRIEFDRTFTLDKKAKNKNDLFVIINKIQDLFGK